MKNIKLFIFSILVVLLLPLSSQSQMCLPAPGTCAAPLLSIGGDPVSGLCPGTIYNYTPSITYPPGFYAASYFWTPSTGITPLSLSSGTGAPSTTPILFTGVPTTYNLTVYMLGPELINNGTFQTGASLYPCFTTQYQDGAGSSGNTDGHMKLGSWTGSGAPCLPSMPGGYVPALDVFSHNPPHDFHSSNRMLNVRGATCFGHRSWIGGAPPFGWWNNDHCAEGGPGYFWGQNVRLCGGENYQFTYWVRLMGPCTTSQLPKITAALALGPNPAYGFAQTNFSFSPLVIGSQVIGLAGGCDPNWYQITYTFSSPGTGDYFICLYDENQSADGNDFSIDDVSLQRKKTLNASITLTPQTHTESVVVVPNDADPSVGIDGFPCAGTNPFKITGTAGAFVTFDIDGTTYTATIGTSGEYLVPFTGVAGMAHTLTLSSITVGLCTFPVSISKKVQFIDAPYGGSIMYPQEICQGSAFTVDVYAAYAEDGKYLTSYSWSCPSFTAPYNLPVSTAGSTATFHAAASGLVTVFCTVTNRCGTNTFSQTIYIKPQPWATATIIGCNPICPGSAATIDVCGTPGASVIYSSTLPGVPPLSFILPPAPAGFVACTTIVSSILPIGFYTFNIDDVILDGCHGNNVSIPVNVRYPKCNLVLDGPEPCLGDPYQIRIYGDPGTYDIIPAFGSPFTVVVPAPAGSYALSPIFYMPGFYPGGPTMIHGMNTFCVTKIVGCGGCTIEATEGSPLCCLNVIARGTPRISLSHTTACTGVPFTITAFHDPVSEPLIWMNWLPVAPDFFGAMTVPPGPHSQTIIPSAPGTFIYTVIAESANGCTYTATEKVTVGESPLPIVGASDICRGETELYSSGPSGGTWSVGWGNVALSGPGLVTGLTVGTAIVRYTLPNGCKADMPLNVRPAAPAIIGPREICVPDVVTFSTASPVYGTWSSSNPLVATVGPVGPGGVVSGTATLVSGISTGTTIITFTNSYGCYSTSTIVVGVAPPITGIASICGVGATSTLSHGEAGGTWSSSNPANVSIDMYTGVMTGVGLGTSTITYHRVSGICNPTIVATVSNYLSCPLVYNPTWNRIDISGWISGATSVNFEMWSTAGLPVGPPVTGFTGSSITTSDVLSGTWYVFLTSMTIGTCTWTGFDCTATFPTPVPRTGRRDDNQMNGNNILSISPNPNTGTFTVAGSVAGMTANETVTIEIIDVLGRIIYTNDAQLNNGKLDMKVIISEDVANGTYLLKVKNSKANEVIRFTLNR